ncbi:MAG: DNA repair protein RecO (recombination protein O) [Paraglaciecola sp.]|jgi:DNA repair protein RecO (recombination protein O)
MAAEQLQGFLLHRRPYRETSYLVDLFTQEGGKISAVVKGVRGSKSDKKSLLQAFQPLLLSLSGKHELKNLNQLESNGPMLNLTGKRLFSAMYINEVMNRLLAPEIPQPELFLHYRQSLAYLAQGEEIEPTLREFELALLEELGYGFDLTHEYQQGEAVDPQAYYVFIVEHGLVHCPGPQQSANYFSGETLLKVSRFDWDKSSLHCAKYLSRLTLSPLLGGRPLKSRELFRYA